MMSETDINTWHGRQESISTKGEKPLWLLIMGRIPMLAQVFYWGKLGVDIAENGKDSLCHGRVQASSKQLVGGEDKNNVGWLECP